MLLLLQGPITSSSYHQLEKLVLEPGACDPTDLQDWLHNLPTDYTAQLGDTFLHLVHVPSYHGLVPHPHLQDDGLQDPRCHRVTSSNVST